MIRNLKVLGLAMAAMLAVGAVAASGASAQDNGMLTSDGKVTLVGTQIGEPNDNAFTAFEGLTRCPESTYTGHKVLTLEETENEAKHGYLTHGDSTVTITPHYKNCETVTGAGTFSTTVNMNGCDYEFHLGETVDNEANTYAVKATVVCPEGKKIQVKQYTSSSHGILACTVTINHTEAGYDGLHATDTTNGKIDIKGTATGINASRSGFFCSTATDTAATLHQDIEVEGRNSEGNTTWIGLSHEGEEE